MIFLGAFTIGERAMPYNLVGGTNTIRESFMPREVLLLLTVCFSIVYLLTTHRENRLLSYAKQSKAIGPMGRMSLSLFLWHQPLFAFYRYFYADELSTMTLIMVLGVTLLLSLSTYYIIERHMVINKIYRVFLLLSFLIINAFSIWIYQQGGAVRDIPELDIRKGEADPMAFERYTDRIYQYDREFTSDSTKRKILVVGNSFARDFANILLKSPLADSIQLSYHYAFVDCLLSRIQQCDRIYFFGWRHNVPSEVWQNLKEGSDIWGIGTKNHDTCNGIFYKNRYCPDYFSQRTEIHQDFIAVNRKLRDEWQDKYVDMLSLTLQLDSTVPVFTPDHHFITYDGMHLTPAGVCYYAQLLFGSCH